jgi:hypothetical protein
VLVQRDKNSTAKGVMNISFNQTVDIATGMNLSSWCMEDLGF